MSVCLSFRDVGDTPGAQTTVVQTVHETTLVLKSALFVVKLIDQTAQFCAMNDELITDFKASRRCSEIFHGHWCNEQLGPEHHNT